MAQYKPPQLKDREPQLVNWYTDGKCVYRREWNHETQQYDEAERVPIHAAMIALTYHETHTKRKEQP